MRIQLSIIYIVSGDSGQYSNLYDFLFFHFEVGVNSLTKIFWISYTKN